MSALRKIKFPLVILALSSICWGRLLFLRGLWADDWAWLWHYYGSSGLSGFLAPFQSLKHEFCGISLFLNYKLLDVFSGNALFLWSVFKFLFLVINALFLYYTLLKIFGKGSNLPIAVGFMYAVSSATSNLCLVELSRRVYLLFFLASILFYLYFLERKGVKGAAFYMLSLLCSILAMLGIESFVFLELARPVVASYVLTNNKKTGFKAALGMAFFTALPFLAIGFIILLYRFGVFVPRSGAYETVYALRYASFSECVDIILSKYAKAFLYLFTADTWYFLKRLGMMGKDPLLFVQAAAAALTSFFFVFYKGGPEDSDERSVRKTVSVSIFGIFLIVIGLFPYLVVREGYTFGFSNRHGLLAALGLAVFSASFLLLLRYSGLIGRTLCGFLFSFIIFVGVFQCNSAIRAYNDDWQQQRSFWWQFMWRVPDIKDKTYVLIDMQRERWDYFVRWRGDYEFAGPLNILYASKIEYAEMNRFFAASFEEAFKARNSRSYFDDKDKDSEEFLSFKGPATYYPRDLMVVSFQNGVLYINREINASNFSGIVNVDTLLARVPEERIIYDRKRAFPLRYLIGPEPLPGGKRAFMDKIRSLLFKWKMTERDWRYYDCKIKNYEAIGDYAKIRDVYDKAEKSHLTPALPSAPPLAVIKAYYLAGETEKAGSLLWKWAFSREGSRERARELLREVRAGSATAKAAPELEKEISRIWPHV